VLQDICGDGDGVGPLTDADIRRAKAMVAQLGLILVRANLRVRKSVFSPQRQDRRHR